MNVLKGLQKTALLSTAAAVLAFGATPAKAAEGVAYLGHISASVTSLLNITEVAPIKFGNFSITCPNNTCDTSSSIVLSPAGTRTATQGANTLTLLYGNGSAQGVANGTNFETASQAPGFYTVNTGVASAQDVFITFADSTGHIIDANHPDNYASITGGAGGTQEFTVDTFTIAQDDGTTGYAGVTPAADATYGARVTTSAGGLATVRVGATLHTTVTAADYSPGPYRGTFYIMASY